MEQINIYEGEQVISRILVQEGVEGLEECLEQYEHVYAVMDENVAMKCYAAGTIADMLNRRGVPGMLVEVSEETKCMDTVMDICGWLLENGADRDALVLAIGGGITTDMVGFAASIYKRGVRFAYVPTTLLAQVDAAIGGKTGVNFDKYKNILGIIRQPAFTYMCPQLLESLPQRDFLSGVAEMLKTFIIEDNGNYQKAADLFFDISSEYHVEVMMYGKDEKQAWTEILKKHRRTLSGLISAAARVKAGVVSRDQFEDGERRKLNLGHTFGHAIEYLSHKRHNDIDHGHAVALGMVYAADLAEKLELAEPGFAASLEHDLDATLLLIYNPYSIHDMAEAMRKDKKAEGGKVHFVLPRAIGDVVMHDLTVDEVVELLA